MTHTVETFCGELTVVCDGHYTVPVPPPEEFESTSRVICACGSEVIVTFGVKEG